AFGADLLGVPAPDAIDYAQADLSEMARSFYSECKRVSNARAKAALGWRPRFRTYREGLTSIRDAGG
ncbi:MAG: SDR family NAD(P)-dependent oxidoreductase, partial [Pseudomonadota bacterium]